MVDGSWLKIWTLDLAIVGLATPDGVSVMMVVMHLPTCFRSGEAIVTKYRA